MGLDFTPMACSSLVLVTSSVADIRSISASATAGSFALDPKAPMAISAGIFRFKIVPAASMGLISLSSYTALNREAAAGREFWLLSSRFLWFRTAFMVQDGFR